MHVGYGIKKHAKVMVWDSMDLRGQLYYRQKRESERLDVPGVPSLQPRAVCHFGDPFRHMDIMWVPSLNHRA